MTIPNPVYELTREAAATRDLLAAMATLIDGDEAVAMDFIEGQTDFIEVVNSLIAQEAEDKAHIAAITALVETYAARKSRLKTRVERRRNALAIAFQTAGIKGALRCALGTVNLNATQRKALPTDEALIPDEFWKQPARVLDLIALRAALVAGRDVSGAELSNGGVAISIRMS